MTREKTFIVPHKGIRYAMGHLSLLLSKTDFTDKEDIQELRGFYKLLFKLMHHHAHDENEIVIKGLLKKVNYSLDYLFHDHEDIENKQDLVEETLDELIKKAESGSDVTEASYQAYLKFSAFQSAYLSHMLEEERALQDLIWKNLTDEEIAAQRVQIISKFTPEVMMGWLLLLMPAFTPIERKILLTGIKANVSDSFFHEMLSETKRIINIKDYHKLIDDLNQPVHSNYPFN